MRRKGLRQIRPYFVWAISNDGYLAYKVFCAVSEKEAVDKAQATAPAGFSVAGAFITNRRQFQSIKKMIRNAKESGGSVFLQDHMLGIVHGLQEEG